MRYSNGKKLSPNSSIEKKNISTHVKDPDHNMERKIKPIQFSKEKIKQMNMRLGEIAHSIEGKTIQQSDNKPLKRIILKELMQCGTIISLLYR